MRGLSPTCLRCLLSHLLTCYNLLALLYAQFFGHGDPAFPTSARHQVHLQYEKDDGILGIVKDSGDVDRYTRDCMKPWCPNDEYTQQNPSCFKWFFGTTDTNPVPQSGSQSWHVTLAGLGERLAHNGAVAWPPCGSRQFGTLALAALAL